MKLFCIGDTEIRLSPLLPALIPALIVLGCGRLLLVAFLSLSAHEAAHALTAIRLGYPVRSVEIQPFGFVARLEGGSFSSGSSPVLFMPVGDAAAVFAAGPVASLSMAACSALIESYVPVYKNAALGMTEYNLLIAAVNLLPALPLDGGRLLYAAFGERRQKLALFMLKASGVMLGLGFIGVFVFLLMNGALNLTFPIMGVFLTLAALKEKSGPPTRGALKPRSVIPVSQTAMGEDMSIAHALAALPRKSYAVVNVLDGSRHLKARLDETELIEAAQLLGPGAKLNEAVEISIKSGYNNKKTTEKSLDRI